MWWLSEYCPNKATDLPLKPKPFPQLTERLREIKDMISQQYLFLTTLPHEAQLRPGHARSHPATPQPSPSNRDVSLSALPRRGCRPLLKSRLHAARPLQLIHLVCHLRGVLTFFCCCRLAAGPDLFLGPFLSEKVSTGTRPSRPKWCGCGLRAHGWHGSGLTAVCLSFEHELGA